MPDIKLTELMNKNWREFSVATCEDRGIPQFADGLKPVQRFLVHSAYKMAKTHFDKVNAIGSSVSIYGYEHGEASATAALSAMGAYFCNNLPLFEGDGSFGNVLDPTPAAPRYIYAKLPTYIDLLFKDTELAPPNPDPEIKTPLYYLPIIPMVLVNWIKGIATGYSVDIPPHSVNSIIDALIALCEGRSFRRIAPQYYGFSGNVERTDDSYVLTGTFEREGAVRFVVTDLPPEFNTSASYERTLRRLEERGVIVGYDNLSCDDRFRFVVTVKRGTRWTDDEVIDKLKLRAKHPWNLTTIMPDGRLHVWDKTTGIEEIVREFYKFRLPFVAERIERMRTTLAERIAYLNGMIRFLREAKIKNIKDEDEFRSVLAERYKIPPKYIDKVVNAPVRSFALSNISGMERELATAEQDAEYYASTTAEKEYKKDLLELRAHLKSKKMI